MEEIVKSILNWVTVFVIIAGFGSNGCYNKSPGDERLEAASNPTSSTNADTTTADSDPTDTHPDEG